MTTAPEIDWRAYNESAAGRPARRLVSQAIAAVGGIGAGRTVLDLGAGGGADAFQFARRGFSVHAYDADDTLAARLVDGTGLEDEVRFHHGDLREVEAFPAADIVFSGYTLPLLGDALPDVWQRVREALRPGGVVAVDLFGEKDSWAEREDIATLPLADMDRMFAGLEILDRDVRDEVGRAFYTDGKKHWHVVSTLARRSR